MNKMLPLTGYLFFSGVLFTSCSKLPPPAAGLPDPGTGILFASDRDQNWEIYRVQPDGTDLVRLTEHPGVDSDPSWFPDGREIAFRSRRDGSSDIFQMWVDGSNVVNLINDEGDSLFDEFSPRLNPTGEIFALYSDRFPVLGDCRAGVHHLAIMPRAGGADQIENFTALTGEQTGMSWSPDGSRLVFSSVCNESYSQIYIYDIESKEVTPLTDRDHYAGFPDWSPDGERLAFASNPAGNLDIFVMDLRSNETYSLTDHPANDREPSWSPDGSELAFTTDRDGNDEVYKITIDGTNLMNLSNHPASDQRPDWSPVR